MTPQWPDISADDTGHKGTHGTGHADRPLGACAGTAGSVECALHVSTPPAGQSDPLAHQARSRGPLATELGELMEDSMPHPAVAPARRSPRRDRRLERNI